MHYIPFHKLYRPKTLQEVVGQDVTISVLKKELSLNKIPNSLIFSGTKGCGKTSAARIVARTLNCTNLIGGNPCNSCVNCVAILQGRFPDVIEMDAGTNSGVEDARSLIEDCKFGAKFGRYKVYIIDEAHNLSKKAWDSLLKTIEEPLSTIKFIFCTTEFLKIPATIISRSQTFFFNRVSIEDNLKVLNDIVEAENIEISKELLLEIIDNSEGSVRDSLNLLEQVLLIKEDPILLSKILNRVSEEQLIEFIEYIISNKHKEAFDFINNLQLPEEVLLSKLSKFLCNLFVSKSIYRDKIGLKKVSRILDIINEWKNTLSKTLSRKVTNEFFIIRLIDLFGNVKFSSGIGDDSIKISQILGGTVEEISESQFIVTSRNGNKLYVVTSEHIPSIGFYCVFPEDTKRFIESGKNPTELLKEGIIKRSR